MSTGRETKKKLTEEEKKIKDIKTRNSEMTKLPDKPRTIPDNFQTSNTNNRYGIFSYQLGVPIMFGNETQPASIKFSIDHNVSTQRGAEQTGLRFTQLNENSTYADHLQNLAVALAN